MTALKTTTKNPKMLAHVVADSLRAERVCSVERAWPIARRVTPIVVEALADHDASRSDIPDRYRFVKQRVRSGLGLWLWILWRFVVPVIMRWIIEWWHTSDSAPMRKAIRERTSVG